MLAIFTLTTNNQIIFAGKHNGEQITPDAVVLSRGHPRLRA